MRKNWIGLFLLLIVSSQVFPVEGIRFWTRLIQSYEAISTASLQVVEEEEVEQIQFKLKNIESNQSHYFEGQNGIYSDQVAYAIICKMGETIDRNEPIHIPPPNPVV